MNYDYEIEKKYHPENFMLDDDIADYQHDFTFTEESDDT